MMGRWGLVTLFGSWFFWMIYSLICGWPEGTDRLWLWENYAIYFPTNRWMDILASPIFVMMGIYFYHLMKSAKISQDSALPSAINLMIGFIGLVTGMGWVSGSFPLLDITIVLNAFLFVILPVIGGLLATNESCMKFFLRFFPFIFPWGVGAGVAAGFLAGGAATIIIMVAAYCLITLGAVIRLIASAIAQIFTKQLWQGVKSFLMAEDVRDAAEDIKEDK